jgi:hypothetical protein
VACCREGHGFIRAVEDGFSPPPCALIISAALAIEVTPLTKPERLPSAVDGQTYFTTSNIYNRRTLFRYETFAKLFIETLYKYRRQGKYQIHPFVVMPEHFHLLLTPSRGSPSNVLCN